MSEWELYYAKPAKTGVLGFYIEGFVSVCADSINYMSADHIPAFLLNNNLDYQYSMLSYSGEYISVRRMIFDRVSNCKALRLIINDRSGIFKVIPGKHEGVDIPYINKSYFNLASGRIKKLKCTLN